MQSTSSRRRGRRVLKTVAPTVAAAAVTAIGMAAFTDEATNAGNRATAASVTITEDVPATSRLFDIADWQPGESGDSVSRCVAVTNGGSIGLPLRLRLGGAPAGTLGDFIDMKIERGSRPTSTNSADCDGFAPAPSSPTVYDGELAAFPATAGAALDDRGGVLAPGAERAYRITWHLQDDEAAEGRSVDGVDFVWQTTTAD